FVAELLGRQALLLLVTKAVERGHGYFLATPWNDAIFVTVRRGEIVAGTRAFAIRVCPAHIKNEIAIVFPYARLDPATQRCGAGCGTRARSSRHPMLG